MGGGLVAGQPYSAEQVLEHTQTLSNGTHINQTREMSQMYRDSEGRTRSERPIFASVTDQNGTREPGLRLIHIYDPVAGYSYTLDPEKHIAHRFTVPIPSEPQKPVRSEGLLVPMTATRTPAGKPVSAAGSQEKRQAQEGIPGN